MFTVQELKDAHAKVKSGADFPRYADELRALGVHYYDYFVADGHEVYYTIDQVLKEAQDSLTLEPKYSHKFIAKLDKNTFINDLKRHQQGETDFNGFVEDCAKSGITWWRVHLEKKQCIYFDQDNNEILVEGIPI